MGKKTDDIHPIIAIPILVAVYAWFDVETNQGRDVAKVMEWYTWIRSFDMVTTEAGNSVSAGISTGLSPLAQLAVVVGFIAVGAVVVTVLGIKSKRDMNKTTAASNMPNEALPYRKYKTVMGRKGARKIK